MSAERKAKRRVFAPGERYKWNGMLRRMHMEVHEMLKERAEYWVFRAPPK